MMSASQSSTRSEVQSDQQSITRLEHLPNELFHVLFGYFTINELYHSLFGLNTRFKNLINSLSNYRLCLEAQTDWQMMDMFASKIKSIYISDSKHFYSLEPVSHSLSALIVENLTENNVDELRRLSNLQYLQIQNPLDDSVLSTLEQYVFSTNQLRHFGLCFWDFEQTRTVVPSRLFSFLRVFHPDDLWNCLHRIPSLTSLQFYDHYCIEKPPIIPGMPSYGHLTSFRLHLSLGFTCSQLDFYLAPLPNLKSFHISASPCLVYSNQIGPYAILNFIADTIDKRLAKLERYLCCIIFEVKSADPFDIMQIHSIYHQNYSIKRDKNIQNFQSKWIKTLTSPNYF